MLKPGGRAAIVLPQGKFNNSSLAFIREWILKKARLLAVVGLHANTFKPHTGTKTSVLFVQKYTAEEITKIANAQQEVAGKCPDYEAEIKALLAKHEKSDDIPDEAIPEAIGDLMAETFAEPEPEAVEENEKESEGEEKEPEAEPESEGEALAEAEEKLDGLKNSQLKAKQTLLDLDSDIEALEQKHGQEIEAITAQWNGKKGELRAHLKVIKDAQKAEIKDRKEALKGQQKTLKDEIKRLEKEIPDAEYAVRLLSNRGKLQLILEDGELIGALKEHWIAAEVAKRLDYPIFMAVSERGGKDTSGDYEYLVDEDGSLVEFPNGHPQEGQLVVDQDLVNYDLRPEDVVDAAKLPEGKLCAAEAFIRFAQQQHFSFWEAE